MNDPILAGRLRALESQLTTIERSNDWLDGMHLKMLPAELERFKVQLDTKVANEARRRKVDLGKIKERIDKAESEPDDSARVCLREAWGRYLQIHDQSQEIFRECLEFVGGLAVRSNMQDDQMSRIADELIRTCAVDSIGNPWQSFSVWAPQEALAMTFARMIRLRFPDWTVWSLPFTAHEYAHVAFAEDEWLRGFVRGNLRTYLQEHVRDAIGAAVADVGTGLSDSDARALAAASEGAVQAALDRPDSDGDFGDFVISDRLPEGVSTAAADRVAERTRSWVRGAQSRLDVLVADAFATYMMGPAYACAAIYLRLTPVDGLGAVFSGAERAHVIFRMLERMDTDASGDYREVIGLLTQRWEDVGVLAGSTVALPAEAQNHLSNMVAEAYDVFGGIRTSARYPATAANEGWLTAKIIESQLLEHFTGRRENVSIGSGELVVKKTRDVLNAAWHCRLIHPEYAERIAEVTKRLCVEIVDPPRRRPPRSGQSGAPR